MPTFNEFQRELSKRIDDPKIRYMMTMLFEQQVELAKQMDACANALTALVETVGNVVELSAVVDARVKTLAGVMKTAGVDVGSVLNEPELN